MVASTDIIIDEDKFLTTIRNHHRELVVDYTFIELALLCENLDILSYILRNFGITRKIINNLDDSKYNNNPTFIRGLKFIKNSMKK